MNRASPPELAARGSAGTRYLETISELAELLTAGPERGERWRGLARRVLREVRAATGARVAFVLRGPCGSRAQTRWWCPASEPTLGEDPGVDSVALDGPPLARVGAWFEAGGVLAVGAEGEPEAASAALQATGLGALAAAPLRVEGEAWGALVLGYEARAPSPGREEVWLLRSVAHGVASVLARERSESALEEAAERFRAVSETGPELVVEVGSDATVIRVSANVREVLGLPPEALEGRDVFARVHPEDAALARGLFSRFWSSLHPITVTCRFRHGDGGWHWVEATGRRFRSRREGWRALLMVRDVTRTRRAEEARRRSEARYRALISNASDVLLEVDARGRIRYVSPNAWELWRLAPRDLLGARALRFVHPADRRLVLRSIRRASRRGTPERVVYRGWHGDGAWHWYESSGRPYRTAEGEERGVLVIRDVTARKKVDDALRLAAAGAAGAVGRRFFHVLARKLAEALGVKCALIGRLRPEHPGRYELLALHGPGGLESGATLPLAGTACGEVIERGQLGIHVRGVRARFPRSELARRLGIEGYVGMPLRGSRGRLLGVIAAMHTAPLPDPELARSLLQLFAARAGAEIERLEVEELRTRLASVVEEAEEGVLILEPGGRVQYANRALQRMAGMAASDVLGVAAEELARRFGRRELAGRVTEALNHEGRWRARLELRRGNAEPFFVDVTGFAVHDNDGRVLQHVFLVRDVTREEELEAELLQAQKLDALGRLAGGIAHDFNNLLTGILGYASLLREAPEPRDVEEAAEVIEQAARRAAELTGQLLSFAGRTRRAEDRVDLHALIAETVRLLRRTLPRNVRVEQRLRAPSAWVQGDPVQLQQVLMNLAINARDAMPEGGVLSFETEALEGERAGDGASARPGIVKLTVSDTGRGFEASIRDRIFEPFFTTKGEGRGGMGLAIVYGIVTSHGGTIHAESVPGRGSRFAIRLPRLADREAATAQAQLRRPTPGGRILVVDDEASVRRVLARMLARLGFEVDEVASGEEAVARYAHDGIRYRAVVLDLDMPGMSGGTCFRKLLGLDPDARVLVSTGFGRSETAEELLRAGARGLVPKPYRLEDLGEALARALEG